MPANFYEWIGFAYAIAGGVIVLGFILMAVLSSLDPLSVPLHKAFRKRG